MLLERTTQKGIALLRPQDILIEPTLGEYGSTSFVNAREIMKIGEDFARAALPKMQHLAVSEAEYAEFLKKRTGGSEYEPIIEFIKVENVPDYREAEILRSFNANIGQPLNREKLEVEIREIHSTGHYRKVGYEIVNIDGKQGIVVTAEEKEWLKNYGRVGFTLEDDFDGSSNYGLAFNTRFNELNRWGGYTDLQLEIGRSPRVTIEGYQPLWDSNFFFSPEVSYSRQKVLLRDDEELVAEYARKEYIFSPKLGYSFGKFGEFSSGWRWGRGETDRIIGEPSLPDGEYDIGEYTNRFVLDRLNNVDFPTTGYLFNVFNAVARNGLGDDASYERGNASLTVPLTYKRTTLLLNLEGGYFSDSAPLSRAYTFGGFFDISGYQQGSLVASDYWMSRSVIYHRIADGGSVLFPFGGYIGLTSEFASLRSQTEAIEDNPDIVAGSVFIGADTPILPMYLGYGMSDTSESSLYFTVGRLPGGRR